MSQFLRLLAEEDKVAALTSVCTKFRQGEAAPCSFTVAPEAFDAVPGKPFAYWVSEGVRQTYQRLPQFEAGGRTVRVGLQTSDDFRFVRGWWEASAQESAGKWFPFAKGGAYSPYYADVYLVVNWELDGAEITNFFDRKTGKLNSRPQNIEFYFRPGLTWTVFTTRALGVRVLPEGCLTLGVQQFLRNCLRRERPWRCVQVALTDTCWILRRDWPTLVGVFTVWVPLELLHSWKHPIVWKNLL